jgi:hypothetical protein
MSFLSFLVENWDTVTLLVTNVGALYMKSPLDRKRERETF